MLNTHSPVFLFFYNLLSFFGALILLCHTFSVQLSPLLICGFVLLPFLIHRSLGDLRRHPWQEAFLDLGNIDYFSCIAENQQLSFNPSLSKTELLNHLPTKTCSLQSTPNGTRALSWISCSEIAVPTSWHVLERTFCNCQSIVQEINQAVKLYLLEFLFVCVLCGCKSKTKSQ